MVYAAVIRFFALVLAILVPCVSHAGTEYRYQQGGPGSNVYSSWTTSVQALIAPAEAAMRQYYLQRGDVYATCSAPFNRAVIGNISATPAGTSYLLMSSTIDTYNSNCTGVQSSNTTTENWAIQTRFIEDPPCPTGQERVDGVCIAKCLANQTRVNGVCVERSCPPDGTLLPDLQSTSPSMSTIYGCDKISDGLLCMTKSTPDMCVGYTDSAGVKQYSCHGSVYSMGQSCSTPSPITPRPAGTPSDPIKPPGASDDPKLGNSDPTKKFSPADGTSPDASGGCTPDREKASDGKCYKKDSAPGADGSCPAGTNKVTTGSTSTCVATKPVDALKPSTGASTGGSGGTTPDSPNECPPGTDKLACATMGGTSNESILRTKKNVTWEYDWTFGYSVGTCPPDRQIFLAGRPLTIFKFSFFCEKLANVVKPIALILATLTAIFIVSGTSAKLEQ
jgi:hypothetical protein